MSLEFRFSFNIKSFFLYFYVFHLKNLKMVKNTLLFKQIKF